MIEEKLFNNKFILKETVKCNNAKLELKIYWTETKIIRDDEKYTWFISKQHRSRTQ